MTARRQSTRSAPLPRGLVYDLAAAKTVREAETAISRWLQPRANRSSIAWPQLGMDADHRLIGIWRRLSHDNETAFVRDSRIDDELFWADVERIGGPKKNKRVILLGESVARGAFLDPLFNCASALRTYLNVLCGPNVVEIVDLARSGLRHFGLLQLLVASAALKPDVFVIFAGNNWAVEASTLDSDAIASALERNASWSDVASYFRDALCTEVSAWISTLADAARVQQVPVLFAIPPRNVCDFRWPSEWHDPLMASAEHATAEQSLAVAESFLADQHYQEAKAAASSIIEKDPRTSARALQICALCALALGDNTEAARLFDQMEETRLYLPVTGSLACRTRIAETIRKSGPDQGIIVVDLPKVFLDASENVPPGRELFLDQMHLTASGIRLSMAAVAQELLPLLGRTRIACRRILEIPVHVDPLAEAQGHFLGAMANAVSYQNPGTTSGIEHDEVIAFHAAEAVRHAGEVATPMLDMVRLMLAENPRVYYQAYQGVAAACNRFPGLRVVLYRMPVKTAQPVYLELARAYAAAAELVFPGAIDECERLLSESVLQESRPTRLLPYAIRRESFAIWRRDEPLYVRSFTRRTLFQLRCSNSRDLSVQVTARHGKPMRGEPIASLLINRVLIHRWELGPTWSSTTCIAPARILQQGINEVCILWPDPGFSRADRVRDLVQLFRARPLENFGFTADGFPAYGDVYALDVSIGARDDEARSAAACISLMA